MERKGVKTVLGGKSGAMSLGCFKVLCVDSIIARVERARWCAQLHGTYISRAQYQGRAAGAGGSARRLQALAC
jgi:hypothetical protein